MFKLSQAKYIEKVLRRFNMVDAKHVNISLEGQFKLSKAPESKTKDEKALMSKMPYALTVGSLMYAMVYTRPDITQAAGVVSRYMSNPR